jgi:hypothetical protein
MRFSYKMEFLRPICWFYILDICIPGKAVLASKLKISLAFYEISFGRYSKVLMEPP